MGELQKIRQKFLTVVLSVGELEDTYEDLIFAESVLEKRQIDENSQEWENLAGKNLTLTFNL